ncbi:hypothetical protein GSI_08645 [Ganoderma sinense ZZ0214-1]|uniref:Uncharacterized protein n=1 Tax=Ganoderma sinense ZZ0214-1 TaxID=1077348 RepID=A0A2G8S496_9APHY|nr:hypothetical protein GSI_08645 [Ganoderma sinense ZZ0214-1]
MSTTTAFSPSGPIACAHVPVVRAAYCRDQNAHCAGWGRRMDPSCPRCSRPGLRRSPSPSDTVSGRASGATSTSRARRTGSRFRPRIPGWRQWCSSGAPLQTGSTTPRSTAWRGSPSSTRAYPKLRSQQAPDAELPCDARATPGDTAQQPHRPSHPTPLRFHQTPGPAPPQDPPCSSDPRTNAARTFSATETETETPLPPHLPPPPPRSAPSSRVKPHPQCRHRPRPPQASAASPPVP